MHSCHLFLISSASVRSILFLSIIVPIFTWNVPFSSVAQLCPTFCDPINCSVPGFPVHHNLLELAKTHVHRVSDAIQPSHHLLSLSSPAFILSKHQSLLQWISLSNQLAKVLEFQLQHQSFQCIFRTDFLYDGLIGTPCSPRGSQEFSLTPSILWHPAFFIVQLSHTWLLGRP